MHIRTRSIELEFASHGFFFGLNLGPLSFGMFVDRTGQGLSTIDWAWKKKAQLAE